MTFCLSSSETVPDHECLRAVEVWSEKIEGNHHRITAKMQVPYPVEQVWQVLTDYEAFTEFIPNLVKSKCIGKSGDNTRIEQVGAACLLNLRLTVRVVLEMMEKFPYELSFHMVEGDFKSFRGKCHLDTSPYLCGKKTDLHYAVEVQPRLTMPIALLEKQLRHDLPANLMAINQRLSVLYGELNCE